MTTAAVRFALIAAVCHAANAEYCRQIGDASQVPWDEAPDWQKESAIKGVEAIASKSTTRPEQSHESWLAEKKEAGWKYGPVKDPEKKEHPCFVPFAELSGEQQAKDHIFFAIATAMLGVAP